MPKLVLELDASRLSAGAQQAQKALEDVQRSAKGLDTGLDNVQRAAGTAAPAMDSLANAERAASSAASAMTAATAANTSATVANTAAQKAQAFALKTSRELFNSLKSALIIAPIAGITVELVRQAAAWLTAADAAEEYRDAVKASSDEVRKLNDLQAIGARLGVVTPVAKQLEEQLASLEKARRDLLVLLRETPDAQIPLEQGAAALGGTNQARQNARRFFTGYEGGFLGIGKTEVVSAAGIVRALNSEIEKYDERLASLRDAERQTQEVQRARASTLERLVALYTQLNALPGVGGTVQGQLEGLGVSPSIARSAGAAVNYVGSLAPTPAVAAGGGVISGDVAAGTTAALQELEAAIDASKQAVIAAQPGYEASAENIRALAQAAELPPPLIERLVREEEGRIATVTELAAAEKRAAASAAEQARVAASYGGAFQSAAVGFLTATETATDALLNFASRVAAILVEQATQETATDVGAGIASLFGSSTTTSALGNAFGPRGVIPFQYGGVVSQPSLFSFNNGNSIGSIAERGEPEAIVPLARDSQGRLGVRGGQTVNLHFHGIQNPDDFRRNEKQIANRTASSLRTR